MSSRQSVGAGPSDFGGGAIPIHAACLTNYVACSRGPRCRKDSKPFQGGPLDRPGSCCVALVGGRSARCNTRVVVRWYQDAIHMSPISLDRASYSVRMQVAWPGIMPLRESAKSWIRGYQTKQVRRLLSCICHSCRIADTGKVGRR
jgi:hypothetical protein